MRVYTLYVSNNYYKCIVTGEEKYIPPSLLKNKLKKFGDIEEFKKHYVCSQVAKLLRKGQTVDEIREQLNITDLPKVNLQIERQQNMTFPEWVQEYTSTGRSRGGTCIRPDVFLSWNDHACDECPYYEHCMCYQKRLSHEKRKPKKR